MSTIHRGKVKKKNKALKFPDQRQGVCIQKNYARTGCVAQHDKKTHEGGNQMQ
jgi:hypothetical protein